MIIFIYTGGGRNAIPQNATHIVMHESVTAILAFAFEDHPNIVEVYCHLGVRRIQQYAFRGCRRLRRLIIPGVEVVEVGAFAGCEAITYIDCDKLERIGAGAFDGCKSLFSINLPSTKVVWMGALANCKAMTDVKFGKKLELVREGAFDGCVNLERITIPLKNGLFPHDNIFLECANLKRVDLLERAVLHDTINALHLEEWRNDMNEELEFLTQILPHTSAGGRRTYPQSGEGHVDDGGKALVIRRWMTQVLRKIVQYKTAHRQLLNEASSTLLRVLPNEVVMNNVLPFFELPLHTFEGEDEVETRA